jgi:hypothetical protein
MMSSLIREELDAKQEDLDLIIELTEFLATSNDIRTMDSSGNELAIDDKLIDILKSVIHMMSYNQVESTLRGCVEEVYDHLADNEVGYDKLQNCMQKEILSAVVKNNDNIYDLVGSDLNLKIPKASLQIKKVFNGNVSKKTFNDINDHYGLRVQANSENKDGVGLGVIKHARNELAHGNMSFSKHGRKASLEEFLEISKSVSSYMQSTITAFDDYIEDEKYLA